MSYPIPGTVDWGAALTPEEAAEQAVERNQRLIAYITRFVNQRSNHPAECRQLIKDGRTEWKVEGVVVVTATPKSLALDSPIDIRCFNATWKASLLKGLQAFWSGASDGPPLSIYDLIQEEEDA